MALDAVFRDQWGRVLATLTGMLGDIQLAEDAAAEAFAVAAERWPRDGEPANPVGWLVTTARNRAIDQLRRQQVLATKAKLLARDLEAAPPPSEAIMNDSATIQDERLELVFTCCHPALALESQVALILRTLGGLSTDEIALAFLVTPPAKRPACATGGSFPSTTGRHIEARHAYRRALDLTQTEAEQRFLQDRLAATTPSDPGQPGDST